MKNEVVFCIPARKGSRRIPNKNMLVLDGETLIARKIRQLLPLGTVVVGSDSDEMLDEAKRHGAIAVRRSKTDEGHDSANDMIAEFLELIEPCDTVVWAHCTNPLISTDTYGRALDEFHRGLQEGYDSLVSVHEIHGHYWCADKRTPMYDVTWCKNIRHLCASDLPPIYEQDGGIFIQSYDTMRENRYFFGDRPRLFEIPDDEFMDINTERDWRCCLACIAPEIVAEAIRRSITTQDKP